LITATLAYLGFFQPLLPYLISPLKAQYFPGKSKMHLLKKFPTFTAQLGDWLEDMSNTINIWPVIPYAPHHNPFLWTIREEFRCSMHLCLTLLALARTRPYVWLSFLVILSQYHMLCGRWEIMFYFWGAAIAQMDVLMQLRASRSRLAELLPLASIPSLALPDSATDVEGDS
jgi:hypothetical protein